MQCKNLLNIYSYVTSNCYQKRATYQIWRRMFAVDSSCFTRAYLHFRNLLMILSPDQSPGLVVPGWGTGRSPSMILRGNKLTTLEEDKWLVAHKLHLIVPFLNSLVVSEDFVVCSCPCLTDGWLPA